MLVFVTIIVAAVIKIINIQKKSKHFLEEDNIKKYGTKGDFSVWFRDDQCEGRMHNTSNHLDFVQVLKRALWSSRGKAMYVRTLENV